MRWWILLWLVACGRGDGGLYDTCEVADDCEAPEGLEPACLEKGGEGYCTSRCADDGDCDDRDLVCASFESDEGTYCFPSCEEGDDLCPSGFGCRSTGGGSDNRKVCFPEG